MPTILWPLSVPLCILRHPQLIHISPRYSACPLCQLMWAASSSVLPANGGALHAHARLFLRMPPASSGGSPARLALLDARPPSPSLDSLWTSLRAAEAALVEARGTLSAAEARGAVSAAVVSPSRTADTSIVIELLDDEAGPPEERTADSAAIAGGRGGVGRGGGGTGSGGENGSDGGGRAARRTRQRGESARVPPIDPTGMLTWMRDGKIAQERARLPR